MQRPPIIPTASTAVFVTFILIVLLMRGAFAANADGNATDEMMRHLASEAVDIADKSYGIKLDYSTESIRQVEVVLGKIHDELQQRKSTEGVRGLASAFGAYIGEAIRKKYPEAKWDRDHPVAGGKSYPLHWLGGDSFPLGWCFKRIMNGPEDNVWYKFTVASKERGVGDAAAADLPTIKMDDAHNMINQPKEAKPASYVIPASDGIILDAAGYRFDIPDELKNTPLNSVQIIQSNTQQFELERKPGTTLYRLDKTTLNPRPGSLPFTAFKKGEHLVIAVGAVFAPGKFGPFWASTIRVE